MNTKQYTIKLENLIQKLESFNLHNADTDYKILKQIFDITYNSEVLNIVHLNKNIQDDYKLLLFTALTKASGTLAFLVIQILAANNIMAKNNYLKKDFYFQKKCGIAINHLRANKTIVSGIKVDGGYLLNGTLTWASGYKIFDTLLIGFHCNNFEYEAMAPFELNNGFVLGDTPTTFVGNGLNTIDIDLKDFFVKDEDIVSSNALGNYTKQKSASKTVHFCIYAIGYNAIERIDDKKFQLSAYNEIERLKTKFINSTDLDELDNLRVELFYLSQNIVTTAMVLNGGSSILLSSYFQRLYRELIMFNSNGLNNTLKSIFKDKFITKYKMDHLNA